MDDAEEDSVAAVSAPLLIRHSLKKRKKIRPIRTCLTRYFSFRFSMKKLFMTSVIVTLILLVYLVSKSNWMFGYHSYHFSVPRFKRVTWKTCGSKIKACSTMKQNFLTQRRQRPPRARFLRKTSLATTFNIEESSSLFPKPRIRQLSSLSQRSW